MTGCSQRRRRLPISPPHRAMRNSDTSAPREIPFAGLVAFEAAARLGSVSRAAAELNLTQSAVSQRLQKLEAYVAQRLFTRQGHGVKLTGAGELLVVTARETLQRLKLGFERIEPYRSKASLLLACPTDLAQGWLLPRMAELQKLHASLEVWLMPDHEMSAIDRVDVDLIVSRRPLHGPDIECVPLGEDHAMAVCAPVWATKLAAVPWPKLTERAPLLLLEREPDWGGLLGGLAAKARLRRAATVQDAGVLLGMVEQGLGVAYLSCWLVDAALQAGRLVHLPQVPTSPRPRLWLMRSRLTPRTPIANDAFDWLRREAAAAR